MTARQPMIKISNLHKVFGKSLHVLRGINLAVHSGEVVTILGPSGSGKSTTGRAILRRIPIVSGQIYFQGRDITDLDEQALRPLRRHMQLVFQDPLAALDPRMTVREIVAEPLRVHRPELSAAERVSRVAGILERVGLAARLDHLPAELSGGEQQRVAIARAIAKTPRSEERFSRNAETVGVSRMPSSA
mgnify:CR=1 FL=1